MPIASAPERGRPDSSTVIAVAALVATLGLAAWQRSGVSLFYVEAGSACRSLTAASADALSDALLVPSLLLIGWALVTGVALTLAMVAAAPPALTGRYVWIGLPATLIGAYLTYSFLGADPVVGIFGAMVVVPVAALPALTFAARARAQRGKPIARPLAELSAWVATVGCIVPVVLGFTTNTGEVSIC